MRWPAVRRTDWSSVTGGSARPVGVVFVLIGRVSLLCIGMRNHEPLGALPAYEPDDAGPHLRLVRDPRTGRHADTASPDRLVFPTPAPSMMWPPLASPPASGSTRTRPAPTRQQPDPRLPIHPVRIWQTFRQVLEVLDGRRPTTQLAALLPADDCQELLRRQRNLGSRHLLRRLRACYPSPRVVEVAAVVVVLAPAGREGVIAAAARFERVGDRWPCTVLRLL